MILDYSNYRITVIIHATFYIWILIFGIWHFVWIFLIYFSAMIWVLQIHWHAINDISHVKEYFGCDLLISTLQFITCKWLLNNRKQQTISLEMTRSSNCYGIPLNNRNTVMMMGLCEFIFLIVTNLQRNICKKSKFAILLK